MKPISFAVFFRSVAGLTLAALTGAPAQAQSESVVQSSSSWVPVTVKSTASPTPQKGDTQVFSDVFSRNVHGWPTGERGGYVHELGSGRYRMARRPGGAGAALVFVPLPAGMNLNEASRFSVQVEIYGTEKVIPEGGLLIGVLDSLNYTSLQITARRQAIPKTLVNNTTFANYLPGKPADMSGLVQTGFNLLRIEKTNQSLRFLVNGSQVGPNVPFRQVPGHGVGLLVTGPEAVFRNLLVTVTP